MVFSEQWRLVDDFTLEQAAYLWCGVEPGNLKLNSHVPGEIKAIFQALSGAAQRGALPVDHSTNPLADYGGGYHSSIVARDALVQFARTKNEYPSFLFDTLGPSNEELAQQFLKPRPTDIDQTEAQESSVESAEIEKNRGGRPEGYDWNACTAEIIRLADIDGLPAVQNELVRHLIGWFEERYGKSPADSVIKSRISPIYRYLKNVGWKSKNG